MNHLRISAPGRICLFGEHQDYLQLPVIPCAISLRLTVEGRDQHQRQIDIALPDVSSNETLTLQGPVSYVSDRDYFRSGLNVLLRNGLSFSNGFQVEVRSEIPIGAGTSSSSALVVAWIHFLAQISDQHLTLKPDELVQHAYEAEVLEFGEPGGMMDQLTSAYGGILAIDFYPELQVQKLDCNLGSFVIGDSGEPKDTKSILFRVKNDVLNLAQKITRIKEDFSLQTVFLEDLEFAKTKLEPMEFQLLRATIRNRDITKEAVKILSFQPDPLHVGKLINEQQEILRDVLRISTPKIDRMIDAALNAGACGAKINGSGGGGCMFAYAPDHPKQVAEELARIGGKPSIVSIDSGSRAESKSQ